MTGLFLGKSCVPGTLKASGRTLWCGVLIFWSWSWCEWSCRRCGDWIFLCFCGDWMVIGRLVLFFFIFVLVCSLCSCCNVKVLPWCFSGILSGLGSDECFQWRTAGTGPSTTSSTDGGFTDALKNLLILKIYIHVLKLYKTFTFTLSAWLFLRFEGGLEIIGV